MQPIQINVNVSIGLNDELKGLFGLVAAALISAQPEAPAKAGEAAEKQNDEPGEQPLLVPQDPQPAVVAPVEEPQPTVKQYTEVDVRAAMDATRKRIEGADYKENTTGEGYKKYHRALTTWFKDIAASMGAEKPSALPDSDSRALFIDICSELYIDKAGELACRVPF